MLGMGTSVRRHLLRPLLGAGLLLFVTAPVAAAEGGHGHCEAPAEAAPEVTQVTVTVAPATIGSAEEPCPDCPETHCATHLPCSVSGAPALVGQAMIRVTQIAPTALAWRPGVMPPVSDNPAPPTPPPNGLAVL